MEVQVGRTWGVISPESNAFVPLNKFHRWIFPSTSLYAGAGGATTKSQRTRDLIGIGNIHAQAIESEMTTFLSEGGETDISRQIGLTQDQDIPQDIPVETK